MSELIRIILIKFYFLIKVQLTKMFVPLIEGVVIAVLLAYCINTLRPEITTKRILGCRNSYNLNLER